MTLSSLRSCGAILGLLLLCACASATATQSARVDVAPGVALILPKAPPFGPRASATQLVEATYGAREVTLQAFIESDEARTMVIMTLANGPRIMSVDWTVAAFTARLEPQAPSGLTGEHMLADMMLIYAPLPLVQAALDGAELAQAADGTRQVIRDGQVLVTITRPPDLPSVNPWNGEARLENTGFGYSLAIASQSAVP